jgi:hypothetical protein
LTTITPGLADKKIDALSLQWFLKFVSVNPDFFSWNLRFGGEALKTAVFCVKCFFCFSLNLKLLLNSIHFRGHQMAIPGANQPGLE